MNVLISAAFLCSTAIQASKLRGSVNEPKPKSGAASPRTVALSAPAPIKESQGYEGDEEADAVEFDYSQYNYSAYRNTGSPSYLQRNQVDITEPILQYNKNFNLPEIPEDFQYTDRRVERTSAGTFVYLPEHGMILYSCPSTSSLEYVPVVPFYPGVPEEFSFQAAKWISCLKFEDDAEVLKLETLNILRKH